METEYAEVANNGEAEVVKLKKQVAVLEQKLALYENDPEKDGYYVLVSIQNQQIQFLRNFKIKDEISKTTKEDATYMRAKDMWENLPKMISDVNALKMQLKISPEEKSNYNQRTTPESIADVLSDNGRQQP